MCNLNKNWICLPSGCRTVLLQSRCHFFCWWKWWCWPGQRTRVDIVNSVCNCKWKLCEEPTKASKGRNSQFKWTGGSKTLLWKRTFSTLLNSLCANNVQSLLIGVFILYQFYHAVFFLIIKINILPNPKDTLLLKALSVMSALPIYGQWSSLMIMFPSIPFWQIHWLHLPISLLPPVCSNQSLLLDHNIPAASSKAMLKMGDYTLGWSRKSDFPSHYFHFNIPLSI